MAKQAQEQIDDFDFDISRTFTVLTATLVLPVYLALSVATFSISGTILWSQRFVKESKNPPRPRGIFYILYEIVQRVGEDFILAANKVRGYALNTNYAADIKKYPVNFSSYFYTPLIYQMVGKA